MSDGYQAVQPAHALAQFATEHSQIFNNWQTKHKNLVLLAVKDQNELELLILKLLNKGIKHSVFHEPDINNEITAIAIEPNEESYKMTSSLPLALRERNMAEKVA